VRRVISSKTGLVGNNMKLILKFDGGVKRGNPGGIPVFGYDAVAVFSESEEVGATRGITYGYGVVLNAPYEAGTNNIAEYAGLLAGIMHLGSQAYFDNCECLQIFGDSQLVIRQLKGEYATRNPNLYKMSQRVKAELAKYENMEVTLTHVRRSENERADSLANKAWEKYEACPFHLKMDVINFTEL
jgi:ribonuclease HI